MDTTTIITILTTGAALIGGAATLLTQLRTLRGAIAPMTRRSKLRWCVLHHASGESDAKRLLASTASAGFAAPSRAVIGDDPRLAAGAVAASGLGCRAVVLVRPSQAAVDAIVPLLREAAPDAVILIYTTDRLQIALGEHALLANSLLRLRGDLGVVAEEAA